MVKMYPLLMPYKATSEDPFDHIKAAHLLNRAGFGGKPEEIEKVLDLGPEKAVDWLMDFPDAGVDEQTQTDVPDLSSLEGYPKNFAEIRQMTKGKTPEERKEFQKKLMAANRDAILQTVKWWMNRMTFGPTPLQEKLTLFWHGHFTSSARDEKAAILMWNQNELLRRNAAGNFRDFVRQISRDPAMLDFLNNAQNRKEHPNENYARELMELFTLGIGNYTENDIKQAARAFTGWAHDGDEFLFRKFEHDEGEKVFFGRRGNLNGDDIIDIILAHPACAKYITGKLFKYFAYEDPEPQLVEALGQQLHENNWNLRPIIRTILTSKAFYSKTAIGTQIKSPIQLVVGSIRLLGLEKSPDARVLGNALNQMGQVPLAPPNVKGWPGGRLWINTSTLFVRYNTISWMAGGSMPALAGGKIGKGISLLVRKVPSGGTHFEPKGDGSPEEAVDEWLWRLVQRPVEESRKQILVEVIDGKPQSEEKLRKMIQLIVSMPEYQLC